MTCHDVKQLFTNRLQWSIQEGLSRIGIGTCESWVCVTSDIRVAASQPMHSAAAGRCCHLGCQKLTGIQGRPGFGTTHSRYTHCRVSMIV